MARNEDIDYTVSDFATPDASANDPEQPNKSVLVDVVKYLEECIEGDKTVFALDLSKDAKLSLEQQVFLAQRDNARLMQAIEFINNKIKELV